MNDYLQVMTTTDRSERADALASALVDDRLAACVQIVGPIRSHYRWRGAVEQAEEWLLIVKTARERLDAVIAAIGAHHHYEVPEITATAILGGNAAYLDWIGESVAEG